VVPFKPTEVFYITDAPFVVPTLVSIESLRRWKSAGDMKINVVLLDINERQVDDFRRLAEDLDLDVHSLSTDALATFGNEKFNATHVPHATLARFIIPQFFRNEDADILYVDGDTLFIEDPKDLLDIPAPEVGLLAAEDQSYFYANDFGRTGRNVTAYFANIGVNAKTGYFNAGVMKFRAREWIKISKDCLSFLESNLAICQYHDQSALNAVAGNKRTRLSPVWNFKPSYRNWGISDKPKLLHFVGGEKPWMGKLQIWSDLHADYMKAVARRRQDAFRLKVWNEQEQTDRLKAERRQELKNRTIFLYHMARRRAMFRALVQTAVL
jgi:lipopolysaccharide biosynthesis glycosyltransferase